MNNKQLKILGYALAAIFVLNIFLFSFGIISPLIFWIVLILGAVFVYLVLPKMKQRSEG